MLLSSFITTNFTAAEISECEVEVRHLLDLSPIVFSYGYGLDPHDPYSMLVQRPESDFPEILRRCLIKDITKPPVYLIGKLETRIESGSRPYAVNLLFMPDLLTDDDREVLELVRDSLYQRALSFFVERELFQIPRESYRTRKMGR